MSNQAEKKIINTFITAQEDNIDLSLKIYEWIEVNKKNYKPYILLLTPLEEIIYPRNLRNRISNKRFISSWKNVKRLLLFSNPLIELEEKYNDIYKKLVKEICVHPTQLYDLNRRKQYKNFDSKYLLRVFCAQALHFIDIFSKFKQSIIIDTIIYDSSRTILLESAKYCGINYRTLIHSRFKNFFLKTENLGRDVPLKLFESKVDNNIKIQAFNEIQDFLIKNNLTPIHERKILIEKFSLRKSFYLIKESLIRIFIYSLRFIRETKEVSLKLNKYKSSLTGDTFKTLLNSLICNVREFRRVWMRIDQRIKIPQKYIYFPLPNTIENSEIRFNGGYLSEKLVIDLLRISIGNIKLLVKDHRSMIKDRTSDQISDMKGIYNLIYLSEWQHNNEITNTRGLIENSLATLVVAGTAGLESALLGKPVFIIGTPIYAEFFRLKGIKLGGLNDLNKANTSDKDDFKKYIINKEVVENYIQSIISYGLNAKVYQLLRNPEDIELQEDLQSLVNYLLS